MSQTKLISLDNLTRYDGKIKALITTPATAIPESIASSGVVGVSTKYAREDHTHAISVSTGDANGQVKIAGQNASVKGLQNSAYNNTFIGTEDEWDNLTTEQKKAYDEYKITDDYVEPTNPAAEDISYDNTSSGLTADDVQSAIDEVNSKLTSITKNKFGGGVDLKGYNTSSNLYEMPSDGYLIGYTGNDVIELKIYGNTVSQYGSEMTALLNIGIPIYCKKGMKCYVSSNTASKNIFFIPFST